MKFRYSIIFLFSTSLILSCSSTKKSAVVKNTPPGEITSTVVIRKEVPAVFINTKNVNAVEVVRFAKTCLGVPYKYASTDKAKGFDCSGFINYVFNHFDIAVPRISWQFTNAGTEVSLKNSEPGDLILFTGSDANSGIVGHMGIITENNEGNIKFIHASTSKGVVISSMNNYYIPRFVKVNRIFFK